MRARLAMPIFMLLAGACKPEPSFDDRYNAQSAKMNETVGAIQADLDNQLNAARAADPEHGGANATAPIANGAAAR